MLRIKYCEFQYTNKKIFVTTQCLHPFFEFILPLRAIAIRRFFSAENKSQLIVTIIAKAENTCQDDIKVVQFAPIIGLVLLNALDGFIHYAQGVVLQKVFNLNIINQVGNKGLLKRKLYFFQNVVLILRKKFAKHRLKGFTKIENLFVMAVLSTEAFGFCPDQVRFKFNRSIGIVEQAAFRNGRVYFCIRLHHVHKHPAVNMGTVYFFGLT